MTAKKAARKDTRKKRPGIFVYMPEDIKKRLDRLCRLTGRTVSSFSRISIVKQLEIEERLLKRSLGE